MADYKIDATDESNIDGGRNEGIDFGIRPPSVYKIDATDSSNVDGGGNEGIDFDADGAAFSFFTINRLMLAKDALGLKIETSCGIAETLVGADYGISAFNIKFSSTISHYMRQNATGDFSRFTSVAGKQSGQVEFDCYYGQGGTITTPPRWMTAARCCCLNQSVLSGGVSLTSNAMQDKNTCTIEICKRQEGATPKQHIVVLTGCVGDAEIVCSVGEPAIIKFNFTGAISNVYTREYAGLLTPSSFDTQYPPAMLSATLQLFSTAQNISKFTVKLGNKIEGFSNGGHRSGYDYFHVVNREPTIEIDPDEVVTSDIDLYQKERQGDAGVLTAQFGGMIVYAPVVQVIENKPSIRNEIHAANLRLGLTRADGEDELIIGQGKIVSYNIFLLKFENNLLDSIGTNNGYDLYNRTSYVTGAIGNAVYCNFADGNAGQAFYISPTEEFDFPPTTGKFNISFYIKLSSSFTERYFDIFSRAWNWNGSYVEIDFALRMNNGQIDIHVYSGYYTTTSFASGATVPYDDAFHYLEFKYEEGLWRIFIDGVEVTADPTTKHYIYNAKDMAYSIGTHYWIAKGQHGVQMIIDELKLTNQIS